MPDYRRYFVEGGTYFFTVVTYRRQPIFQSREARRLLGNTMRAVRNIRPYDTVAIVLLPDHLHVVWTLPRFDANYSDRWRMIKARFSRAWLQSGRDELAVSPGYERQRRRGVWQPRFIEHTIRDDDDLIQHCHYIHFNPVKHGYVTCPADWKWSSFPKFVDAGDYDSQWGCGQRPPPKIIVDEELLE